MEHYFASGRNIKLVVQLVDMRHPASADDVSMINYLISTGYKFIIVLTKSDKLNKTEYKNRLEDFAEQFDGLPEDTEFFPFSSQNGEGLDRLKAAIETALSE